MRPLSNGFHTHSKYGSPDSPVSAEDLIKRSLELGRNALTITDHGRMSALPAVWKENEKLKSKGKPHVQVIHGIEPYVLFEGVETNKSYFHQTFLFKTQEAYLWFSKMSISADKNKNKKGKPIFQFKWLKEIAGEVVFGTGCLQGIVSQLVLEGRFQEAEMWYLKLRDIFGKDNFFVELMPHVLDKEWHHPVIKDKQIIQDGFFSNTNTDLQEAPNKFLFEIAKKYGDKMVISEDSHLAWSHQKPIQDILLGQGWRFSVAYTMEDPSVWAPTLMKQTGCGLDDINQMIDNSYIVSSLCEGYKFRTHEDGIHIPNMKMIYGEDKSSVQTLLSEIQKNDRMPKDEPKRSQYINRMKLEIDVFVNNGVADFIPYVLLVHEVVKHFRSCHGYITPRGSAAGSLILYLLGITIADPIKYGLSFARFLTKGRIAEGNFPDIDLDCGDQKAVFEYLEEKYKGCFCQVCTDMTLKLKTSIKDVERVYKGFCSKETESVSIGLPAIGQGVNELQWLFGYEQDGNHVDGIFDLDDDYAVALRGWANKNPELWETVQMCLGVNKTTSTHPCACLITQEPIYNVTPLMMIKDTVVSQYTHDRCEYTGGIKYDFLKLDTMSSIGDAYRLVQETTNTKLVWGDFQEEDVVFEEIIAKDNISGIFQMSAKALRPYVKRMPPKSIIEISNIIALIRPGALDAPSPRPDAPEGETAALFYVECANGRATPYFVHEDLRPIVEETYSVILYQEQIMQIFTDLAGYEEGEAAAAMKAVSKKKKEALEKHCGNLRKGCLSRGWNDHQIDYLISSVMASARYSFNKSHSLSYSINAYIECWLKYHYPLQFWSAKLTVVSQKSEKSKKDRKSEEDNKFSDLLVEAKKYLHGFDIKRASAYSWVIDNNKLIPPIIIFKGVGLKSAENISEFVKKFEWNTFEDMIERASLEKKEDTKRRRNGEDLVCNVDVSSIITLLFHGLFDKYLVGRITVDRYHTLKDFVLKSFKSKAACSGVSDIKNEIDLMRFRAANNPVYSANPTLIPNFVSNNVINMGYTETHHKIIPFQKENTDVFNSLDFLEKNRQYANVYRFTKNLQVIALIKGVNTFISKNGKPYWKIQAQVGCENHTFMVFADKKGLMPVNIGKTTVNGRICLLSISIDEYNGGLSYVIKDSAWVG